MEIHSRDNEQGPVVALVLALIVVGLGGLFLTWQNIARQKDTVRDHMVLSGGSILRGVESNLMRLVRAMRNNPAVIPAFPSLARDLFTELASTDDISFIGIYDAEGVPLIASDLEDKAPKIIFNRSDESIVDNGQPWHYMHAVGKRQVMLSGVLIKPNLASMYMAILGLDGAKNSKHMMRRMGPGSGMNQGKGAGPGNEDIRAGGPIEAGEPRMYLVVGLNAEKHLRQFQQYRRAAILQTGYVFLAAVVLWSLAFAYLRRREQGERLVRLEQFQNRLLDNMPDGLVSVNDDGLILAANGSAKRLLAPPDEEPAELLGNNWRSFPFAQGECEDVFSAQYDWEQHDYLGRQLEILAVPFPEGDASTPELGQRLILIRDRTRIRCLEEDLNEARRLAAIGSLAAGVAHEVRNPLSSLRGFAQFFADKLKDQEPLGSYATTMVQEADRLNRVVTDLLYLARPRELAPETVYLDEVADSLTKLMRFDLEHQRVEPHFEFETDEMYADPDALRQILLNLTANSLDAVAGREGEAKIVIGSRADKSGVWLTVRDNGPGMENDVRDQALRPFFTAKKNGTGLGLAIVNNIIRAHKGRMTIDSEPGEGTQVNLFFPNAECASDFEFEK